jgi:hypothetical protein
MHLFKLVATPTVFSYSEIARFHEVEEIIVLFLARKWYKGRTLPF